MKLFNQLHIFCLVVAVFFLPIHLNLNNIFLVCFICLSLMKFVIKPQKDVFKRLKRHRIILLVASFPFLLNLMGLIYTDEFNKGLNVVIRLIPFLCIPIIAVMYPDVFRNSHKKLGYALLIGCLLVVIYSWSSAIVSLSNLEKPWRELFGPLYSHHNLVKPLDLHAAYLSICIYTVIGFLVSEYKTLRRYQQIGVIVVGSILMLFMFHLLSRNAILFFILSSVVFLVYKKYWKALIGGSALVVLIGVSAYNVKHNYLRDRIFKNLNFFEKQTQFSKKDDRFDRLAASYTIFKENPIIGYGTSAESKYRKEIFKINGDTVAYNENYNAHNQFFEYLSTFGILGGLTYILFFIILIWKTVKLRNGFFVYIILGLFFACLTESIFERSQGVVYTSICIALLLSFKIKELDNVQINSSDSKA